MEAPVPPSDWEPGPPLTYVDLDRWIQSGVTLEPVNQLWDHKSNSADQKGVLKSSSLDRNIFDLLSYEPELPSKPPEFPRMHLSLKHLRAELQNHQSPELSSEFSEAEPSHIRSFLLLSGSSSTFYSVTSNMADRKCQRSQESLHHITSPPNLISTFKSSPVVQDSRGSGPGSSCSHICVWALPGEDSAPFRTSNTQSGTSHVSVQPPPSVGTL